MKEIEVKKRGWVAYAAAVFFFVLFLLTLFSNTILNRSLPEVAAQYTQASTINARIRGSGTVTANETVKVQASTTQSYIIESIYPKVGDMVETGDVLFTLSKDASKELEEAKEELRKAELTLEEYLATAGADSISVGLHHAITNARNDLAAAQEKHADALARVKQIEGELVALGFNEATYPDIESRINTEQAKVDTRLLEEGVAERNLLTYIETSGKQESELEAEGDSGYQRRQKDYFDAIKKRADAENELDKLKIQTNFDALKSTRENWGKAKEAYTTAEEAVTTAQQALSKANQDLAKANESLDGEQKTIDIKIREMNREIDEWKEKVEKLQNEGSLSEVTAPVSGKVTEIPIEIGKETKTGENEYDMLIEIVDRGYSLSFPVTTEQSSRVSVGDSAEVDRGWWSWGEPLTAVLTGIRPDPQNPAMGRLLVFSVSGENIDSGTQLNVTVAQRSENYGIVIPKSAIRSDTNGDFVLIVETRRSPLRNRYIATRVDVTILAQDDTNAAISGAGLAGWDFVITTSTRPIESGMQVRLVDNP